MALVRTGEIVARAVRSGTAAVAFNVLHLESAEALAAAAEQTGVPLILSISENCIRYHHGLLPLLRATLAVAAGAEAELSVHLDHITDPALIRAGVEAGAGARPGVSSVMIDASALPWAENVGVTTDVATWCHRRGVYVEAELGEVGGKDGVHAPGARTDPAEALRFVQTTGVDALAVAVGSSHAMTERTIELDQDLIGRLHATLPVPLVLHGSSGVPDEEIRRAVAAGMTKINISTHLVSVFTATVREVLAAQPDLVDSRKYLGPARDAVADEAARLLRVLTAPVPAR